jgi:hypothetical protein
MFRSECANGEAGRLAGGHLPFPRDIRSEVGWVPRPRPLRASYTDTKQSPWFVVPSDDTKVARLNCIHHLLSMIPYADHDPPVPGVLPPRPVGTGYVRPPREDQTYVPPVFS